MHTSDLSKHKDYYNARWSEEYVLTRPPNPERVKVVCDLVARTTNGTPHIRILDVGCGNGWMLSALASRFPSATLVGIEPSSAGVENSRQRAPSAEVHCGTLDDTKCGSDFDVVVCSEVLEHVQKKTAFLESIANVLTADGAIVLTTPNGKWRNTYFDATKASPQPIEEWVTRNDLYDLLRPCFSGIAITTFGMDMWFHHHPIWTWTLGRLAKRKGGWRFSQCLRLCVCSVLGGGLYLAAAAKRTQFLKEALAGTTSYLSS